MIYPTSKKAKIVPVSPVCRKRIYNTMEDALEMIKYIRETRVTREIHAYKCNICGFWHLTSSKEGNRRKAPGVGYHSDS